MSAEKSSVRQEDPSESWPNHIRFHVQKDFAGVPQKDGSYVRLDRTKLPKDFGQLLADDYVSAFPQIFQQGPRPKPHSASALSSRAPSLQSDHSAADQNFAVQYRKTSNVDEKEKVKRISKNKTSMRRKIKRKNLSESDDGSFYERNCSPVSRDSSPSLSSTDSRSLENSCTSVDSVPVRQSERRIRAELLQNAVLDDDLGIGIGDDENQKRSWHKPRVYSKEIMQHRFSQGRILFQVKQPSGHLEWLEQSVVEEIFVEKYKAERLKPGEQLVAPGRKRRKPSSGRRPGRPRKDHTNEVWISALLSSSSTEDRTRKIVSAPSSYDATSSSSSDSEWESEISI